MAQFLFVYHGGGQPDSPEDAEKAMLSTTVNSDGSVDNHGGANPTTGYGIFEASDLAEAIGIAKGCPILADGGSVEIAETFDP